MKFMTKVLIDTNILVYSAMTMDKKHNLAVDMIDELMDSNICVISIQNIVEASRVLLEKVNPKMNSNSVNDFISRFLKNLLVINYTPETIIKANLISEGYKIHFFDALLIATMQENGITSILTENISDFKKVPGIKVISLSK